MGRQRNFVLEMILFLADDARVYDTELSLRSMLNWSVPCDLPLTLTNNCYDLHIGQSSITPLISTDGIPVTMNETTKDPGVIINTSTKPSLQTRV